jgi:hypothetical protein
MRLKMESSRIPAEEPYRRLVLDHVNAFLSNDTSASPIWWTRLKAAVCDKFTSLALSTEEHKDTWSLQQNVNVHQILVRLQEMMGIRFSASSMASLRDGIIDELVEPDLEELGSRVKHMNVSLLADAIALSLAAIPKMNVRLFTLSLTKFDQAAQVSPSSRLTMDNWAQALLAWSIKCLATFDDENYSSIATYDDIISWLSLAVEKYSRAANAIGLHRVIRTIAETFVDGRRRLPLSVALPVLLSAFDALHGLKNLTSKQSNSLQFRELVTYAERILEQKVDPVLLGESAADVARLRRILHEARDRTDSISRALKKDDLHNLCGSGRPNRSIMSLLSTLLLVLDNDDENDWSRQRRAVSSPRLWQRLRELPDEIIARPDSPLIEELKQRLDTLNVDDVTCMVAATIFYRWLLSLVNLASAALELRQPQVKLTSLEALEERQRLFHNDAFVLFAVAHDILTQSGPRLETSDTNGGSHHTNLLNRASPLSRSGLAHHPLLALSLSSSPLSAVTPKAAAAPPVFPTRPSSPLAGLRGSVPPQIPQIKASPSMPIVSASKSTNLAKYQTLKMDRTISPLSSVRSLPPKRPSRRAQLAERLVAHGGTVMQLAIDSANDVESLKIFSSPVSSYLSLARTIMIHRSQRALMTEWASRLLLRFARPALEVYPSVAASGLDAQQWYVEASLMYEALSGVQISGIKAVDPAIHCSELVALFNLLRSNQPMNMHEQRTSSLAVVQHDANVMIALQSLLWMAPACASIRRQLAISLRYDLTSLNLRGERITSHWIAPCMQSLSSFAAVHLTEITNTPSVHHPSSSSSLLTATPATPSHGLALRVLCAHHCRSLTNDILTSLMTNTRALRELSIADCPLLSDVLFSSQPLPTTLQTLEIRNCGRISGDILIASLPIALKSIWWRDVSITSWQELVIRAPQLTQLCILSALDIDDEAVSAASSLRKSLKRLSVRSCPTVTGGVLRTLYGVAPYLTSLDLSRGHKPRSITDAHLVPFIEHSHALSELNLQMCSSLTDASLMAISRYAIGIRMLNIAFCEHISDDGLLAVIDGCRRLQRLHTRGCSLITSRSYRSLKRLTWLDVRDLSTITSHDLHAITITCPSLLHLRMAASTELIKPNDTVSAPYLYWC